jgi:PTH1 family peptidyl-tRNA hydrolase
MKFLIVGLGNMGAEYEKTRHNIGFDVVDALAKENKVQFKQGTLGDTAVFKYKGRSIYLLKPTTFMNRSGKSVNHWIQKLKIQRENLLVVMDDLNLDLGRIRIRAKGKDGGHNGLKSIDQYAGGNNYARLRLGIGNNFFTGQQVNYVLGNWESDEENKKDAMIDVACKAILSFSFAGIQNTMNQFNN